MTVGILTVYKPFAVQLEQEAERCERKREITK